MCSVAKKVRNKERQRSSDWHRLQPGFLSWGPSVAPPCGCTVAAKDFRSHIVFLFVQGVTSRKSLDIQSEKWEHFLSQKLPSKILLMSYWPEPDHHGQEVVNGQMLRNRCKCDQRLAYFMYEEPLQIIVRNYEYVMGKKRNEVRTHKRKYSNS